jgi:hypothetical protein
MKKNNVQTSQHGIKRYLKNLRRLQRKTILSTAQMREERMRKNIYANFDMTEEIDKDND